MFDGLRSDQSVPITPQGAPLQGISRGMSDMEMDREKVMSGQRWGGFKGFSCAAFNLDNNPGGATITRERILSPDPEASGDGPDYPGCCYRGY